MDEPIQTQASTAPGTSMFAGNKGLIIAIIVGIVVIVFGLIALFSLNPSDKYKGMIQNMENQTVQLQKAQQDLVR